MDIRLGSHVGSKGSVLKTIQTLPICFKTCQIFLGSPQSVNVRTISSTEKKDINTFCEENDFRFYVHAPYVINISNEKNSFVLKKLIEQVTGIPAGIVYHIGCHKDKDLGIKRVTDYINELDLPANVLPNKLLLENCAGSGNGIGGSWDEIRQVFEKLDTSKVALCIDTQHSFASGICSWQEEKEILNFFDTADEVADIQCIHLNDSKVAFNSKKDRHEVVGKGYIWSKDTSGLKLLTEIATERNIDLICETSDFGECLTCMANNGIISLD